MKNIRISDRIAEILVEHGVKHSFMVTGGGAMHLNDAFGRNNYLKALCASRATAQWQLMDMQDCLEFQLV